MVKLFEGSLEWTVINGKWYSQSRETNVQVKTFFLSNEHLDNDYLHSKYEQVRTFEKSIGLDEHCYPTISIDQQVEFKIISNPENKDLKDLTFSQVDVLISKGEIQFPLWRLIYVYNYHTMPPQHSSEWNILMKNSIQDEIKKFGNDVICSFGLNMDLEVVDLRDLF